MKNLRTIEVPGSGPEDTLMDDRGNVYCSMRHDGHIVRVDISSNTAEIIAETGGAPLGLEWLPDGRLLVCNADLGPQIVDLKKGAVDPLPSSIDFGLCNNAHVLEDGTILVSDSSSQYPLAEYQKDLIENTATGRLVKISPDGDATVLLQELSFANGVVCIDGGKAVLVAETGTGRINKVSIDGEKKGLFARAPGHPDNMSIGSDGNIWVAIPSLTSNTLAKLHNAPVFLRKVAARLPLFLQPKPELCCRVAVYDPTGKHIKTYNGDTGLFNLVTGVREMNGKVALGSIEQTCIAVFDVD